MSAQERYTPHGHEVEPARKGWRCLAKGCGWSGTQTEAIKHAVRFQWSEPGRGAKAAG